MKLKNLILLALTFLPVAVSCGEDNGSFDVGSLSVSPESVEIDAIGGQVTVNVKSTDDWLARSDASWAKVLNASGKGGQVVTELRILADENTSDEGRKAEIVVKTLNGNQVSVRLSQSGRSGEPVERGIANADDLVAFAKAVNEGASVNRYMINGIVKIVSDIDVSSIKEWVPAGTAERPMSYSIDGGGHSIYGISWTVDISKYPDAGLIGYAKDASVRDIVLEGAAITLKGSSSKVNAGAFVGYAANCNMTMLVGKVNVVMTENSSSGSGIAIGGICGFADGASLMGGELKRDGCVNEGNILTSVPCNAGGLAGHNEGKVTNCTNRASILGKSSTDGKCGPAWGCSYNRDRDGFTSNYGYGNVGDYDQYKTAPDNAPDAMFYNAVVYPEHNFDVLVNTVDWTLDSYYDWEELSSEDIRSGVKYHHYSCTNIPRHIHVLEIDMNDAGVEITTSYADDIVPNPNGNKNANNGKNIRETLSELCERKRAEGMKVIAGINTGFFDSNDGISRGFHIEDGEPVYINNPKVFNDNYHVHGWGFTVFDDRTMSCGKKTFSGKLKVGSDEYDYYTVNDTTLRHISKQYPVNVYTSRYAQYPHSEKKSLVNRLAANALYLVAEYVSSPMKVNCGYAEAVVKAVYDGTSEPLATPPYLSGRNEVAVALSGTPAAAVSASVKVGDKISLRCDIGIKTDNNDPNPVMKPILTQNSSAYYLMKEGEDYSQTPGAAASVHSKFDPMTFPVLSKDGKKVWLVVVDGRQDWYSTGVKGYEIYRIAKKLGGWNCTRFDGGGSTCMWLYNGSSGKIVNSVSDSNGERSCLNYLLITEK